MASFSFHSFSYQSNDTNGPNLRTLRNFVLPNYNNAGYDRPSQSQDSQPKIAFRQQYRRPILSDQSLHGFS